MNQTINAASRRMRHLSYHIGKDLFLRRLLILGLLTVRRLLGLLTVGRLLILGLLAVWRLLGLTVRLLRLTIAGLLRTVHRLCAVGLLTHARHAVRIFGRRTKLVGERLAVLAPEHNQDDADDGCRDGD